jgi:hypothetical protein
MKIKQEQKTHGNGAAHAGIEPDSLIARGNRAIPPL